MVHERPTTCIYCKGPLGVRYLYCSDACARRSRLETVQAMLDAKYGKGQVVPNA